MPIDFIYTPANSTSSGGTGAQGAQGPQGFQGYQGLMGLTGPQGDAGGTGPQGVAGTNGTQGNQGVAGAGVTIGPQSANSVYAGPVSGGNQAPTFRSIADQDLASTSAALKNAANTFTQLQTMAAAEITGGNQWTTANWKKGVRLPDLEAAQFGSDTSKFGIGSAGSIFYIFDTTTEGTAAAPSYRIVVKNGNVGINNVNPAATLAVSGGVTFGRSTSTGNYTVTNQDCYVGILDTSTARTVTLPAANTFAPGQFVTILDESGGAQLNNITVNKVGADSINGTTSAVINTPYGVITLVSDGASNWYRSEARGPQGLTGTQGRQGVQGTQGPLGLTGNTGNTGTQGDQGVQGYQGIAGIGTQGTQGFQGFQGRQGLAGQGTQGFQGIAGQAASQGDPGPQGNQGNQGFQGRQGTIGSTGTQGNQGVTGSGTQGTQGVAGQAASQGDPGAQGNQGYQGFQGVTGATGTQGNQGVIGLTGTQGNQGVTGSGTQGNQGVTGGTGPQGVAGTGATMTVGGSVTGGTTGSVLFVGSSQTLGQDNTNFFWDDSNNFLGLGTNGPQATLDVFGGVKFRRRAISANTTITGTDHTIAVTDTTAARTITLPAANSLPPNQFFIISDESGGAGTNNITITPAGSDTIEGKSSYVIQVNYGSVRVYTNGVNRWMFDADAGTGTNIFTDTQQIILASGATKGLVIKAGSSQSVNLLEVISNLNATLNVMDSGGYFFPYTMAFVSVGVAVTTGTNKTNQITMPRAGKIVKAFANAKTGPSGADLIFDINKNGTSIWATTQANRLKITSGSTTGTQTSFDTTTAAEGDVFSIDFDQVGSSIAGQDVTVQLLFLIRNQ